MNDVSEDEEMNRQRQKREAFAASLRNGPGGLEELKRARESLRFVSASEAQLLGAGEPGKFHLISEPPTPQEDDAHE